MRRIRIAGVVTAIALVIGLSAPVLAGTEIVLSPGSAFSGARGEVSLRVSASGVLSGEVEARGLPNQAYGSGLFYGVWFVRGDGSKAFLGALARDGSIILATGRGEAEARFRATKFTDGPAAGSPITLGASGTNQIVVLVENAINGLNPSPSGPNPVLVGSF